MKHSHFILVLLILVAVATSCHRTPGDVPEPARSMYYWRTTMSLDSAERAFLSEHGVKKLYVRYFDVVMKDSVAMPNATLHFPDSAPDIPAGIEVIPTVFIVENVMHHDLGDMARLVVERVVQISATNGLATPREVQIDCDWTRTSMERFYAFLRDARAVASEHGMRLSATIRLHQLTMPPPPVDYGVLMVYNTGDATKLNGHNPILDLRDVKPYLRHLANYQLPLCAAYPCYEWQLLFRGKEFKAVLHGENLADSSLYRRVSDGHYAVVASRDIPELSGDGTTTTWVTVGDSVIVFRPTASQIIEVARALAGERRDINRQVVLYTLDRSNTNKYTHNDYETIFHP